MSRKIPTILFALGLITTGLLAHTATAMTPSARTMNLLGPNVGVEGYDPVSYWSEGGSKPMQGTIKLTYNHAGVNYRFVNEKNLETFKMSPERFLPQYGGYCAWAIGAINQRVDVNPNHYVIRDGKLYLFFSDANIVTHDFWKKDTVALIEKGDAAYGKLLAE
ncbi:YHS domain-containing (seleno)protein [Geothrix sp. 21YS21S-2]|uniref:YHS domain-containing (seleno)protein n=1 Tax=Geothrix sp. 21YS21S-2 TaxID=3068893 RepID=UPI0027B9067C|nr:YHS domain-containing (seleno)protein [Geothrix sp. 21YS21S-2]